jgi:vanillate O-demethylase ferredoxin subunit
MLQLRVRSITYEAQGINSFELVHPTGEALPSFTAGAHIDVHVPGGYVRNYSLCNSESERHRYLIGVLHVLDGRGGSRAMHEKVRPGDTILVSEPRNQFSLSETAERHLLIAGGIGITPLLAMLETLKARRAAFEFHYCTRSPERTAFMDRLEAMRPHGSVSIHHDHGNPALGLDVEALLQNHTPGTHLYFCGPAGFMEAARRGSAHWPQESVHFEYFVVPSAAPSPGGAARENFKVRLAIAGCELDVPAGRSILEVLRAAGIECESSCEAGICGTCRTRYLDGEPEHNDMVLTGHERNDFVMICCARSRSEVLTLDL